MKRQVTDSQAAEIVVYAHPPAPAGSIQLNLLQWIKIVMEKYWLIRSIEYSSSYRIINNLNNQPQKMEKQFLLYLLYITLVEMRERSYEQNDKRSFWLCDLLHNVPLALPSEESTQEAFKDLIEKVHTLGIDEWLQTRKKEFIERYPHFATGDNW